MRGSPVLFANFAGGLNLRDSPYSLPDGTGKQPAQARDLMNMVGSVRGAIRKRDGSTEFSVPGSVLHSMAPYRLTGGQKGLVGAGGTKLFKITSGGVASDLKTGMTAGRRWEFVQAPTSTGPQGPIYAMNGVDTPQQWDGAAGSSSAWTASAGTLPNGRFMVMAGNRLFVAGIAADPSAVVWSNLGNVRDWPAANITRFAPDDGDAITGLGVVGPYLLVFKERKAFVVTDLDTLANRPLSGSIGCVAHRSIAEGEDGFAYFLAPQGVFRTNGSSLERISENVEPLLDTILPALRGGCAGVYANNHYYLSIPTAGAENNVTLDYDVALRSWWLHSLAAGQWAVWGPGASDELELHAATADGVMRFLAPGVLVDGADVFSAWWTGPVHTFGAPSLRKRCRLVHFDGQGRIEFKVGKNFAPAGSMVSTLDFAQESEDGLFGVNDGGVFGTEDGGIYGGASEVGEARAHTLGVSRAWSITVGNREAKSFEIDSYTMAMQTRKD